MVELWLIIMYPKGHVHCLQTMKVSCIKLMRSRRMDMSSCTVCCALRAREIIRIALLEHGFCSFCRAKSITDPFCCIQSPRHHRFRIQRCDIAARASPTRMSAAHTALVPRTRVTRDFTIPSNRFGNRYKHSGLSRHMPRVKFEVRSRLEERAICTSHVRAIY